MPIAKNINGININYKILDPNSSKKSLLMIMGLGFSHLDWGEDLPNLLAQKYKVILFDNRGSGQTSSPNGAYTISQMAKDTKSLLDFLKVKSANVFGVSMGGMIAQELAIKKPKIVDKLFLGCTFAGGSCSIPPNFFGLQKAFISNLLTESDPPLWSFLFTQDFIDKNRSKLRDYWKSANPFHSDLPALLSQLNAIQGHDTCDLLSNIKIPTVVITGDKDKLIPKENSQIIKDKISSSQLEVINDAGHAFPWSHPRQTFDKLQD